MIRFGNPARLFVALLVGFGLALLLSTQTPLVQGAKPDKEKDQGKDDKYTKVKFNSPDGVELGGKFYEVPKGMKSKNATVLMLHDFTKKGGGDSEERGWTKLAEDLQSQGYDVLTFDFRGHGDSKNVTPQVFWATGQSSRLIYPPGFNPTQPPGSIDQKTFPPAYYMHLVDDISGAKAYLDKKSISGKQVNSSNVILIGAGQGATVGAMWLYGQNRLHRQKGVSPQGLPDWDEAEGRDIACAIWLSMSPTLEGTRIPHDIYLPESEKTFKVPMFFMYGAEDKAGEAQTQAWLRKIMPNYKMLGSEDGFNKADKDLKLTRDYAIKETKLTGSKLLNAEELETGKKIAGYMGQIIEERGIREARRQEPEKFAYYYWTNTNPAMPPGRTGFGGVSAKNINEDIFKPISLSVLHLGGN